MLFDNIFESSAIVEFSPKGARMHTINIGNHFIFTIYLNSQKSGKYEHRALSEQRNNMRYSRQIEHQSRNENKISIAIW